MRISAYNIKYELQEEKIVIHNRKGIFEYSYDDVNDLELIHTDDVMQIDVITFKIKENSYAVSMIRKREFAEEFYNYIEKRCKNE